MRSILGKLKKALPVFRTRLFAVILLGAFSATSIGAAALNTNTVEINENGETQIVLTMREDVDSILDQAGIQLGSDDEVVFSGFEDGFAQINIQRAFDVTVEHQGECITMQIAKGSVQDALEKAGFMADAYDVVNFSLQDQLVPGMHIIYKSIDYEYTTDIQTLEYETITEYDENLESGQEEITEGKEGAKEVVLRHRIENGTVVDTAQLSETVLTQPVNAVKRIGTKVTVSGGTGTISVPTGTANQAVSDSSAVQTVSSLQPDSPVELDANGAPVNYSMLITGKASAYSANAGALTASGRPAQVGHVAVNPNQIPYGSKLYIRTSDGSMIYGYAVAADTGGFASQGRITVDLFFSTNAECLQFGVRSVEIYVLS